jgi:peroxiredoxin
VDIRNTGAEVVAVSVESVAANKKLAADLNLSFPILSDANLSLLDQLGMVHEGAGPGGVNIARPGTFIIDRRQRLVWMETTNLLRHRPDPEDILVELKKLAAK